MDQERFDELARGLVSGTTRRGMVRTLTGAALGGILAAVGVRGAGAKKKGGSGKGKGGGQGQAAKVAVCHYDADTETYVSINVSQSGWENGHSKHKRDFKQADKNGCCLDRECSGLTDQCHVGKCVVSGGRVGACKAVPTPGEICDDGNACTSGTTCDADGTCGGGQGTPCPSRECHTGACNPRTGGCDYTPTPGEPCGDRGTCDGGGNCVCRPKTCAELGRTCGTAPDDGCGNPLNCGPASVCGSDTDTNCCAGRCCKANGILCSSSAECCNGDCRSVFGIRTCYAFTDYVCAP